MDTIMHSLSGEDNRHGTLAHGRVEIAADRLLATAARELEAARAAGSGGNAVRVVDHLARLARRQHGGDLVAARRTLAVVLGRVGNPHTPVTVGSLAARVRIARRHGGGSR